MRTHWEFHLTPQIVFGPGSIRRLDGVLKRLHAEKVLLITDQGIARSGILPGVLGLLQQWGYEVTVYDQAVPEPPMEKAVECADFAEAAGPFGAIIGLGGGSSIDLAKIVALLTTHGGHPKDYFGEKSIPGPVIPLIAIPTTAGTGSEVTSVAVVEDTENRVKVGLSNNYLRPLAAILDPELTVNLPPYVTACSGIDALAHAVEAYMAKDYRYIQAEGEILFQGAHPLSDTLALEAIRLIGANLVTAVQQGSNLEARTNMLLGSLYAGMAFSNAGTASAHALAYPLGSLTRSPHGELTGLLLPCVMKFNADVERQKLLNIGKAFGLATDALDPADAADRVVDHVRGILQAIGLPTKLSSIGVKKEWIPDIAEKALKVDRLIRNNPRTPTKEGFVQLLESAY